MNENEVVIIANYSHPLTDAVKGEIKALLESKRVDWHECGVTGNCTTEVEIMERLIPCQIDLERNIVPQVRELVDQASGAQIIVPPALGIAAYLMGAYLSYEANPIPAIWLVRGDLVWRLGGITNNLAPR